MMNRPTSLIAAAALLPSLAACGGSPDAVPEPLSEEALAAVTGDAGGYDGAAHGGGHSGGMR